MDVFTKAIALNKPVWRRMVEDFCWDLQRETQT
jgi:hypothetical protein